MIDEGDPLLTLNHGKKGLMPSQTPKSQLALSERLMMDIDGMGNERGGSRVKLLEATIAKMKKTIGEKDVLLEKSEKQLKKVTTELEDTKRKHSEKERQFASEKIVLSSQLTAC